MRPPKRLPRLLAELAEREEVVHRLCSSEAARLPWGPPAAALRALAAHASESLDELRPIARARRLRIGWARALARSALRRLCERLLDTLPFGRDRSCARMLAAVRAGLDAGRALLAAAAEAGDVSLVRWSERWLSTRRRLATEATSDLAGTIPSTAAAVAAPA